MTTEQTSPMESVDKALLALEALAGAEGGMSLGTLAAHLGLKKNSLHRTLAALRFRGYVIQDQGSGNYGLGPSILRIADTYFSDSNLRGLFHPLLVRLVEDVNELCHLGVLDGTDIVHIDKIEPRQSIRVWSSIGSRSPAPTSALGRAVLAFQFDDFEAFSRRFKGEILQRTANTLTDWHGIWNELRITRLRGYALESEEGQIGVSCVAIPVLRLGRPILSISVSAPVDRMSRVRISQLVASIRDHVAPNLPLGLSLPKEDSDTAMPRTGTLG